MRLIFLGPPGVGKGTYASRIAPKLGIPHISTGELLREEVKNKTELGLEARKYMDSGELVPDKIVIGMLKKRLEEKDCEKGFILDGFPRTPEQAEALEGITKIDMVVNFRQRKDVLIEKISARRTCKKCGEIYNLADIRFDKYRMPPVLPKKEGICDKCGGELYQRDDDRKETVEERLGVYERNTKPLIDYYRERGLIKDVDVIGGPEVMVSITLEAMGLKE